MTVKRTVAEYFIESRLVRRVEAAGGVALKLSNLGKRGFFDRLVVLPGGRVVFCECKRPRGGVTSAHQRALHKLFRELGATVAIVLSEEDIDRVLRP